MPRRKCKNAIRNERRPLTENIFALLPDDPAAAVSVPAIATMLGRSTCRTSRQRICLALHRLAQKGRAKNVSVIYQMPLWIRWRELPDNSKGKARLIIRESVLSAVCQCGRQWTIPRLVAHLGIRHSDATRAVQELVADGEVHWTHADTLLSGPPRPQYRVIDRRAAA